MMRIDTKSMSYEEWKETRRKGIGGSDAAAIAGLNRFKSPLAVYLEKVGEIKKNVNNEYTYWGNILEDLVAKEFEKRTGKRVHRVNAILIHPEYPWMIANIDRKISGEDAILECKTTSAWNAKEWKDDEIPQEYIIQVQHYMAVTNTSHAYIAVLIGGNKFVWKKVERDEELIQNLIKIEKEFWDCVESKTPPDIDGSKNSTEILNILYPSSTTDDILSLPGEANKLIEERNALAEQIKQLDEMKAEKENRIKALLGEHESGRTDKYFVSWKQVKTKRFDSKTFKKEHSDLYEQYAKESSYRRLTIKEGM